MGSFVLNLKEVVQSFFCLINFGGELLAVIVNNQPGQFPYIILLSPSLNDGSHRLRIADIRYDFSPHR